jgi:hypothetical protein
MCSVVVDDPTPPPVPLHVLETQICEAAADLAAATCRWLTLVAEFDARGGWAEWGVQSCAHWLSWRCGISLRTGREHVRVARALQVLPQIRQHFATGELSYSKVRVVTRVARAENEAELLQLARGATGAQLDRLVQGYAGVIRATREQAQAAETKQFLSCTWSDDGMLRVEGRLTAADGAVLLKALEAAAGDDVSAPMAVQRAQALVALAGGERTTTGEVVVHVDADTLAGEHICERCDIEDGPSIAPEIARRLGCDGALVTIIERDGQPLSVGRRTRAINPALRRALKTRDGGCRFPGCTHTRYLHAHHIEHWAHGGRTEMGNLVQLCPHHHRLVHEGGYEVDVGPAGQPQFRTPHGWIIPPQGEVATASGTPLRHQNHRAGVDVTPNTCRPLFTGDRLDYGIAVEGLAHRWLPPPE